MRTKGGVRLFDGAPLVPLSIRAFVTDTPGLSFCTSTRYFTHTAGCHKCEQRTVTKKRGSMSGRFYTPVAKGLRTDKSFAIRRDVEHHD